MLAPSTPSMPVRRADVIVQAVGDETLLYDEHTHEAFCLNQPTALVWSNCDGTRTPAALAAVLYPQADPDTAELMVHLALAQLSKDGLVEHYSEPDVAGLSRRALLRQAGAGLALALPAISMVATPRPAQAYAGCFDCSDTAPAVQRRLQQQQQSSSGTSLLGSSTSE